MLFKDLDIDHIMSFRYQATVGDDNGVRIGGLTMGVPPGPERRPHVKANVDVRQLYNGSWRINHLDRLIPKHSPSTIRESLRILGSRNYHAEGVIRMFGPFSLQMNKSRGTMFFTRRSKTSWRGLSPLQTRGTHCLCLDSVLNFFQEQKIVFIAA
jgi:hypothetical protein